MHLYREENRQKNARPDTIDAQYTINASTQWECGPGTQSSRTFAEQQHEWPTAVAGRPRRSVRTTLDLLRSRRAFRLERRDPELTQDARARTSKGAEKSAEERTLSPTRSKAALARI